MEFAMVGVEKIPEWMGTAVLGAVIAAAGYVAKLLLEWLGEIRKRGRTRRSQLVELHSLLRAGKAAFNVQCENRDRLEELIFQKDSELAKSISGYERLFTAAYPNMSANEKELHAIIRAITTNTIQPLNKDLLEWLREDTYFKATTWGSGLRSQVARKLADLEAHLFLWRAKYTIWIPNDPAHSLVYMADEERHGVGFPNGIEDDVQELLKKRWWVGG
jgi:hypothetical protein